MKLLFIELYLYKPFLHHKTKHVIINDLSHVTVISGENACGKSSLLRACTPYPAVSTEFEKGGYKKVIYQHAGIIYELTSDFRKTSGAHSFIRDGIELNESGTTEVQNNLVDDYFGYNDVVEKLVTGKYKICDMGKPDRKTLFMSTYPSSMAFILEHYKAVSTRLRAVNNNIKMLTQRKIALEQQILSAPVLADYRKEQEDLVRAAGVIDLDIYTVNKAIKFGKDELEKIDPNIRSIDPSYFSTACWRLTRKYKDLLNRTTNLDRFRDIQSFWTEVILKEKEIKESIENNETVALNMRNEINQYKGLFTKDIAALTSECKRKLEIQNKIISETYIDETIPVIDSHEFEVLSNNYEQIKETIAHLRLQKTPYWSEQEYRKQCSISDDLNAKAYYAEKEIRNLTRDLEPLRTRLANYTKRTYPADCIAPCKLREEYSSIVSNCEEQVKELEARLQVKTSELATIQKEMNTVIPEIKARESYCDTLWQFERFVTNTSWGDYVLDSVPFYDALNMNINDVYNRITLVLENAKNVKIVKEARDMKNLLETQLLGLSDSDQALKVVKEAILKKDTELAGMIATINTLKEKLKSIQKDKLDATLYKDILEDLNDISDKYNVWQRAYFLNAEISHFSKFVDDITASKNKINEKLRELEQIIKEQDSYLVRLNDEVVPELNKLTEQQKELAAIEAQLSPTRGISHVYIIRYINSIFKLANQFISRVWSYPMSLEYIDENDESFDYSFKLVINETSSIKDINIASAGQKSIINLCVMLAICIFRHYGSDYPIILDEVTVNMSLNHQNSLITFLNELFADDTLTQIFIVDHCIDVCSSFASIAEMVCLSRDFDIGQEWKRIGTIE